jgi:predicted Zn finger-like uncharacterized protein
MTEQVIKECPQCKSVLKVTNTAGSRERTVKCPKCQTPITVQFGDVPANATYQASPSSTQAKTPQKNHKWLIAALVAVILILAGVVIGLLVSKGAKQETKQEAQPTEQVEEVSYPTGDPELDAQYAGELVLSILKSVERAEDWDEAEKELDDVQQMFEDYYKDRSEKDCNRFNDLLNNDTVLNAEIDSEIQRIQNLAQE